MKKYKWYQVIGNILILTILLPFLLIFVFVDKIQSRFKKPKQNNDTYKTRGIKPEDKKCFKYPFIPISDTYVSDEEFIERFSEFVCIQFDSYNGLSGGICLNELIASEHLEYKEQLLAFIKEHPIENLLYGNLHNDDVLDDSHWRFRFIFDDSNLNRTICGYGITEDSCPFLRDMMQWIPPILSLREQAEKEFRMWQIKVE